MANEVFVLTRVEAAADLKKGRGVSRDERIELYTYRHDGGTRTAHKLRTRDRVVQLRDFSNCSKCLRAAQLQSTLCSLRRLGLRNPSGFHPTLASNDNQSSYNITLRTIK